MKLQLKRKHLGDFWLEILHVLPCLVSQPILENCIFFWICAFRFNKTKWVVTFHANFYVFSAFSTYLSVLPYFFVRFACCGFFASNFIFKLVNWNRWKILLNFTKNLQTRQINQWTQWNWNFSHLPRNQPFSPFFTINVVLFEYFGFSN